jgi:hypothetical protein
MLEKYTSSKIKSVFYGRAKVIATISIVFISYGLFFYCDYYIINTAS